MAFPATRLRRLRATAPLRGLVRETELAASHLVYPMFVVAGGERRTPIPSMPGHRPPEHRRRGRGGRRRARRSASRPCCCSACRPPRTSRARAPGTTRASIQLATRAIKAAHPDLLVIADLCLCEYTSHGHCGVLRADGVVDNDPTLELLARTAVSQAEAGADAVAPSDMMDGRVGALRARARRARPVRDADHRLQREVRLRLLRPVPRGGRLGARRSATAAATRWIPPTRARPCARRASTRRRAPTS